MVQMTDPLDPQSEAWLTTATQDLRQRAAGGAPAAELDRTLRVLFARVTRAVAPVHHAAVRSQLLWAGATLGDRQDAHRRVWAVYRGASQAEQSDLLRGLGALPHPEDFVDLAIDACRTNSQAVFRAIAHDNPYPAQHFPDPAFAQLVLKAMFMDLDVAPILGLERRVTPQLLRMAQDLADERTSAGRPVPSGIAHLHRISAATP